MSNNNKRVTFTIAKDGGVQVNDVCGAGASCQEFTRDIESLLGKVDENSRHSTDSLYAKVDPLELKNEA